MKEDPQILLLMAYIKVASFPFSKRSNSVTVIFNVFLDFMQRLLRSAMSESALISRVGLPMPY